VVCDRLGIIFKKIITTVVCEKNWSLWFFAKIGNRFLLCVIDSNKMSSKWVFLTLSLNFWNDFVSNRFWWFLLFKLRSKVALQRISQPMSFWVFLPPKFHERNQLDHDDILREGICDEFLCNILDDSCYAMSSKEENHFFPPSWDKIMRKREN